MKIEIEAINKTQTEDILKKMLGIQTGTTRQASPTEHKRQKTESQMLKI